MYGLITPPNIRLEHSQHNEYPCSGPLSWDRGGLTVQVDQATHEQSAEGLAVLEQLPNGIALIKLGKSNERVIKLTPERIASLRTILEGLRQQPPRGVILCGPSEEMFTVGADISLIAGVTDPSIGERLAREGQDVFGLFAALPCPTIAAISGPCVGGGCEMVLACSHRLITEHKSSNIGLPEVKLGILPGFGGTQRLPRLIGLPKALDIILSGKTLRPKQALKVGLVDGVFSSYDKMRERAEAIILGTTKAGGKKIPFVDRLLTFNSLGRRFVTKKASASVRKETKGFYPAPPAALKTAVYGLEKGLVAGLAEEARQLGLLITTPESKALVKVFFLLEKAKAIGKSARSHVEQLYAVVIGSGVMGAGIAGVLAKSGSPVILKDTNEKFLERGMQQIREFLGKLRYLSESERSFILNRIEATTRDSSNLGSANFVIEAVFEDLNLKKKILGDISALMPQDAVIATNTSSLSVSEIAAGIANPERVIGMHFFNPVDRMPLVEIIRGKATTDKYIAIIAALATKLGKFPIVVNDVPGFLVNRILSPYLSEAAHLLADGFSIDEIDRAATAFGMPMGPLRLLDEVGLDVAVHVAEIMVQGYGQRMAGPGFAKILVERGRKGKKSGGGFYDFQGKEFTPHPEISSVLGIEKGRAKKSSSPDASREISNRLFMSLINEAVRCLDEGVAGQPSTEAADQINLGTVMGIGFPPFRGGLLSYADTLGARAVLETLRSLEGAHGMRFSPAPGIEARVRSSRGFQEAL